MVSRRRQCVNSSTALGGSIIKGSCSSLQAFVNVQDLQVAAAKLFVGNSVQDAAIVKQKGSQVLFVYVINNE